VALRLDFDMAKWLANLSSLIALGIFIYLASKVGIPQVQCDGRQFQRAYLREALLTVYQLLYNYFVSPLSSIPNAGILAPISRLLWAFPLEYRGLITLDLPLLHETHGI